MTFKKVKLFFYNSNYNYIYNNNYCNIINSINSYNNDNIRNDFQAERIIHAMHHHDYLA